MSHTTPKVSLLIPCFNAADYLTDLFVSIEKLDVHFDQILFYDDGSSDQTVSMVRQAGITIIEGKINRGVAFARNRLMEHATSEWLHFHDADDPIVPDFLKRMLPLMRPDVDVAVCDADWIDGVSRQRIIAWRYDTQSLREDPLLSNLRAGVTCNSMVVRRKTIAELGGFDESMRMWEDADLHIRLAATGARYESLGDFATISVRRGTSFSHDYRTSWNCRLSALERYAGSLPNRVMPEIASQAEIAARALLTYRDKSAAKRALALNHRLGGSAPCSRNLAVRATRVLLGAWAALRLQEYLRGWVA